MIYENGKERLTVPQTDEGQGVTEYFCEESPKASLDWDNCDILKDLIGPEQ